jgi:hypothetical protein
MNYFKVSNLEKHLMVAIISIMIFFVTIIVISSTDIDMFGYAVVWAHIIMYLTLVNTLVFIRSFINSLIHSKV